MSGKGVIQVYTGEGKGKTTAALGVALRASGHGQKVCMIQFIKGTWPTGELTAAKYIPGFEIHTLGKGFVGIRGDQLPIEEHRKAAEHALSVAKDKMSSGEYDILILDEINVALSMGLISVQKVVELVKDKPDKMSLIFTGRNAPKEILKIADLITEMKMLEHYFNKGGGAIRGIDY
jgi:cob(I)alamin adenosyltransferase